MLLQNPGQHLSSSLDDDAHLYWTNSFVPSTSKIYTVYQLTYLDFCTKVWIAPVPISQTGLGRYIAYLSIKLTVSSIRQYLNIVRLLHLENCHANPLSNNWYIERGAAGKRRCMHPEAFNHLGVTSQYFLNIKFAQLK